MLFSFLALCATAAAARISLQIAPSAALANPAVLAPTTHATLSTLSSDALTAYASAPISQASGFTFQNVSAGSYLVDIHCATHAFMPIRVDVGGGVVEGAWDTFRGNEWDNRGEAKRLVQGAGGVTAFEVKAVGGRNYFVERPAFSILSILKNPMILMAIFGGGMFMLMPYLMDNMDPEMRAEFEASQKSNPMAALLGGAAQGGNAGAGGFDMAEYLSGAGTAKDKAKKKGRGEKK